MVHRITSTSKRLEPIRRNVLDELWDGRARDSELAISKRLGSLADSQKFLGGTLERSMSGCLHSFLQYSAYSLGEYSAYSLGEYSVTDSVPAMLVNVSTATHLVVLPPDTSMSSFASSPAASVAEICPTPAQRERDARSENVVFTQMTRRNFF